MDRQPWLCWGSEISIDGNTSRSGIVKPNLAEAVGKLTWPWGAPPTMKGQHQFRECVQSTGLYSEDRTRNVTIHTLRHTFGSQLPIQGIPLRRIQELIGHEAITTTDDYAHLLPEETDGDTEVLQGMATNRQCQSVTVAVNSL